MKTGSFSVPHLLSKASLQLVSGGVNPNYPTPNLNNSPVNLSGIGGSNLHSPPNFVYGLNATIQVMPHLTIQTSVYGNSIDPLSGGAIQFTVSGQ